MAMALSAEQMQPAEPPIMTLYHCAGSRSRDGDIRSRGAASSDGALRVLHLSFGENILKLNEFRVAER